MYSLEMLSSLNFNLVGVYAMGQNIKFSYSQGCHGNKANFIIMPNKLKICSFYQIVFLEVVSLISCNEFGANAMSLLPQTKLG